MDFNIQGVEHKADSTSLVPIGGRLPYYLEVQTNKLLDFIIGVVPSAKRSSRSFRKKVNLFLYVRTKPGFYLEINEHLHLAYADQRDGHGTSHWWRLFFDNDSRPQVEQFTHGTALTVGSRETASTDSNTFGNQPGANAYKEWGGMYFRSQAEIKIAEELDKQELLFFANARGRFGSKGSPVSEASGLLTGRVEVDFLVFYKHKCVILEVDGQHHNESSQTSRDYLRDRILLREGIPTVRFAARECFENASDVVTEFLNVF
jgi:Protein of unknown function (DUF559)